jgi:hypothetical protein
VLFENKTLLGLKLTHAIRDQTRRTGKDWSRDWFQDFHGVISASLSGSAVHVAVYINGSRIIQLGIFQRLGVVSTRCRRKHCAKRTQILARFVGGKGVEELNARSIRSSPPANLVPLIPRAKEESLVGGLAHVNPPAEKPGAPMI